MVECTASWRTCWYNAYVVSLWANFLKPEPAIMNLGVFGTCAAKPGDPLLYGADLETARRICCNNRDYAERYGYWSTTNFPRQLPQGRSNITFYDTVTGDPLFVVPRGRGRTYDQFVADTRKYGWPAFRFEEAVAKNVRILPPKTGATIAADEVVSTRGTHLGHVIGKEDGGAAAR
mmetsp:Transcript_21225/g.35030  ORF Transcript_21225/g.35030 Transcript_21225/m.35030 type:complete len:176 (-) Transcript_21225:37-564(-)